MTSARRLLLFVTLVLTAVPAARLAAQDLPPLDSRLPTDPVVTKGTLPNGLTYYVRQNTPPDHRVQLRLAVKTGSVFEADDQRGLAHMLEHMAFNGTDHFRPGELVSYFQTAGARFGAHVNAYTSYDQTVFMLQVATDKPGLIEKGLLALSDFAGGMTLDPAEIDKERGVVIEEWRMRQGAGSRLLDKEAPVLYYHSRYADRLPIGTPEILRSFTPQRLRDFYETWYRPDRMAVFVVGDIDPAAMVPLVEQAFKGLAPKRPATPEPDRAVPPHAETLVSVATDPEAQATTVTLFRTFPTPGQDTVGDYRRDLVQRLMFQMLNLRFAQISRRPDTPFLAAGAGNDSVTAETSAVSLAARVEDGKVDAGLRALIVEARRARDLGFAASELDQTRRTVLSAYEQALAEKGKSESGGYSDEYIRNFITGEPFPGIKVEHDLTAAMLPGISLEEVGAAAKALLGEDNRAVLISAPEKAAASLPNEAKVRSVLAEAATAQVTPWTTEGSRKELLASVPAPGHVTSTRALASIGVTVVTLSNGVDVWLKPTDFKNDQVLMSAYARGGTSTAPEATYLDAALSASLVNMAGLGGMTPTEINSLTAGKLVSVSPFVDLSTQGIRGACRPQDLETMFQLAYLTFTSPNTDQASFDLMKRQLAPLVANREQSPDAIFSDRVRVLNAGPNRFVRPLTVEMLPTLKLDAMRQAYTERFGNAANFTFFMAGNFKPAEVIPLLERYVASLPSTGHATSHNKPLGFRFPSKISTIQVARGREPKSDTIVTFFADTGGNEEQIRLATIAAETFEMRLVTQLREELGGTYAVSARYGDLLPETGYGTITVNFGSAPENVQKLTASMFSELEKLRQTGPSETDIRTIAEQTRQDLETSLKENGFWVSALQRAHMLGLDPEAIPHRADWLASVTPAKVAAAVRQYIQPGRYTIATLVPAPPAAARQAPPAAATPRQ